MGRGEDDDLGPEALMCLQERQETILSKGLSDDQARQVRKLESDYKDVFSNKPGYTDIIEHQINTPPRMVAWSGSRNWLYNLWETINKEVDKMLTLGITEPSRSPWRNYLVVVPKPDGNVRLCIDYRRLN